MDRQERLSKNYVKAGGKNVATIPWTIIAPLIAQLLGGCARPQSLKRWAKRNPEQCKELIANKLKDDGDGMSQKDRVLIAESAHATLLSMSNEELEDLR